MQKTPVGVFFCITLNLHLAYICLKGHRSSFLWSVTTDVTV